MASRGITITHSINVGHRLSQLPGQCENIHGHTMSVKIEICGRISERGLLFDMDLRDIKGPIKEYLDNAYDHRLLLNKDDELVSPPRVYPPDTTYPGLRETDGDPTTENIALWVGQWVRQWMFAQVSFKPSGLNRIEYIRVDVQETPTNGAFWVSS